MAYKKQTKNVLKIVLLLTVFLGWFCPKPALAADATYRYIKWEIIKRKSATDGCSGSYCIQAAEFVPLLNGSTVSWPGGTTATNPGGTNPGSEGPSKAIDGNVSTKWLDSNFNSDGGDTQTGSSVLIINTGSGNSVTFNGYKWSTANDETVRDPISWNVYGSNNGSSYTLIGSQTNETITDTRNTYTSNYTVSAPYTAPSTPEFSSLVYASSLLFSAWYIISKTKKDTLQS